MYNAHLGSLPGDQDLVPGVVIEVTPLGPNGSVKLSRHLDLIKLSSLN